MQVSGNSATQTRTCRLTNACKQAHNTQTHANTQTHTHIKSGVPITLIGLVVEFSSLKKYYRDDYNLHSEKLSQEIIYRKYFPSWILGSSRAALSPRLRRRFYYAPFSVFLTFFTLPVLFSSLSTYIHSSL